ncbi:hypothetical protein ATANTOWER_001290 [Ataeniobius toweri]|uniref:Protein preY, mitochondrial n=2 Tax=Percomorphaceae TaxID=1489872 RepID=A0ABU7C4Z0_9TELE|nr:hypothetical protein [Ataeniobius toweri]
MLKNVLSRLVKETVRVHRHVSAVPSIQTLTGCRVSVRSFAEVKDEVQPPFDSSLLEVLVCPLSKKPLRYDANTNELINEELGIAYPIVDGIPNMIPQEARLLQKDTQTPSTPSEMFSLSVMVGLVPIVSLFGLFYSAAVDENFPQGCTSSNSLCFYSLLLPVTIPVYVFFHLWSWMGIKLFRHN